ncbi:hypothetical protein PENSPDRAFT_654039 [Peniophora sp. CONT]|nr:hypothetical protein PENSPDRAFT_654039 [Peniophora sp. CONT]
MRWSHRLRLLYVISSAAWHSGKPGLLIPLSLIRKLPNNRLPIPKRHTPRIRANLANIPAARLAISSYRYYRSLGFTPQGSSHSHSAIWQYSCPQPLRDHAGSETECAGA